MTARIGNIEINRYTVLLALVFLFGLGVFLYPFICNAYYQSQADAKLAAYEQAVKEQAPNHDYTKEFAAAQKFNDVLIGQTVPDVFAIREGTTDKDYEKYLNVLGDGTMGYIEIPAIDVHLPIYHYSTEDTLLKGCGHIFGSSLPVGGESSHAVITAHRGLPSAKMFSDLDQVHKGDQFYLNILDQKLAYEVDNIETVEPSETRSLAIEKGKDLVTLVTCTPYGVNTERLLVRGHRVPYVEGAENADTGIRPLGFITKVAVAAAGVAVALLLLWIYTRIRRKRQEAVAAAAEGVVGGVVAGAASVGAHAAHAVTEAIRDVSDSADGDSGRA